MLLPILAAMAFLQKPEPAQGAVAAPYQADVKSVDSILAAVYDVISGPPQKKRDWDRFRFLFLPDTRFAVLGGVRNGKRRTFQVSLEEYVKRSGPIMEREGFFEKEIGRHTDTFGPMKQVFSAYESRLKSLDAKPFERGVNAWQLLYDGSRWWISGLTFVNEEPGITIPRNLIGKKG